MADDWEFDSSSIDVTPEAVTVGTIILPARVVAWLRASAAYEEIPLDGAIAHALIDAYDNYAGYRADVEHSLRLGELAEEEAKI